MSVEQLFNLWQLGGNSNSSCHHEYMAKVSYFPGKAVGADGSGAKWTIDPRPVPSTRLYTVKELLGES